MIETWSGPFRKVSPVVTIRKAGIFAFWKGANKLFGIGSSIQHFTICYDRDKSTVIFVPAVESAKGAMPLYNDDRYIMLRALKFFEQFGIDTSVSRRYEISQVDKYPGLHVKVPVYIVDLAKPLSDLSRRRGKSRGKSKSKSPV